MVATSERGSKALQAIESKFNPRQAASAGPSSRQRPGGTATLSFGFLLLPHFTLTAFSGFVDMLRLSGDQGDNSRQVHCRWSVIGPTLAPVDASCGVKITPLAELGDPARFDYIVVVGGLVRGHDCVDPSIVEYLRRADQLGVTLVGVCTGTFVLARAGLMNQRRCCVHWYHLKEFAEAFPDVQPVADELFIVEEDRVTCAGGTAVIDLAAYFIQQHWDSGRAIKGSRQLVIDWPREPRHSQMPFEEERFDLNDARLRKAVQFMNENLGATICMTDLARKANISVRQLDRRFRSVLGMSPGAYHRTLRLKRAAWLISQTTRSITQVAFECGFADSSHLSRVFRQAYGLSPGLVRRSHPRANEEPAFSRSDLVGSGPYPPL
ncbi:transcriptional regulator, AraC family with amidase-like domain [Arboricoccus pini]|uniref:Transcriptional regulator, AraC family with amidase-like domain n=1 Tax=Arboricoccus pini TaxID=1963835 RepID=A0A212PZY6_9PROT|nr:GlxA family transcriptional regulator [Arboricoccus pini]SNB52637.1 transcriptional regulator, AraC family with amidase-like domain [Arboricoccus pini]